MAQYVSLELLKKQVRADDFGDDDGYLQHLLDTAEAWVIRETGRAAADLLDMGGGEYPLALVQAALLLAGHWYNQREAVSSGAAASVPYTIDALLKPFVCLVADSGAASETASEAADRAEEAAARAAASAEEAAETAAEMEGSIQDITAEEVGEIWEGE